MFSSTGDDFVLLVETALPKDQGQFAFRGSRFRVSPTDFSQKTQFRVCLRLAKRRYRSWALGGMRRSSHMG
jgi:hypothetical protein